MQFQCPLYKTGNLGKFNPLPQEKFNRYLISGTKYRRAGPTIPPGFNSQPKAGEGIKVGWLKGQATNSAPVKPGKSGVGQALRVSQGILNGQAHIGAT